MGTKALLINAEGPNYSTGLYIGTPATIVGMTYNDDDTSTWYMLSSGITATYVRDWAFDTYSFASIRKVTLVGRLKTLNVSLAKMYYYNGSNYYYSGSVISSSWATFSKEWTTNPATGSAWTQSELNNAVFGINFITNGIFGFTGAYVTYMEADVEGVIAYTGTLYAVTKRVAVKSKRSKFRQVKKILIKIRNTMGKKMHIYRTKIIKEILVYLYHKGFVNLYTSGIKTTAFVAKRINIHAIFHDSIISISSLFLMNMHFFIMSIKLVPIKNRLTKLSAIKIMQYLLMPIRRRHWADKNMVINIISICNKSFLRIKGRLLYACVYLASDSLQKIAMLNREISVIQVVNYYKSSTVGKMIYVIAVLHNYFDSWEYHSKLFKVISTIRGRLVGGTLSDIIGRLVVKITNGKKAFFK